MREFYVAIIQHKPLKCIAIGCHRHIFVLATFRIKWGRPHFMRESRMLGSVRGVPSNGHPYRKQKLTV